MSRPTPTPPAAAFQIPPQSVAKPTALLSTCHLGVALRAVLFVSTVAGVEALFHSADTPQWIERFSVLNAGLLPATLSWLISHCALQKIQPQLAPWLRWLSGLGLGAAAGVYGCAMLTLTKMGLGLAQEPVTIPPWSASMAAGVLLSAILLVWLSWQAKAQLPAATEARLAELQSCIRPHFLFNTLNTAIALVREQPRKAEAVLEDLSELFRSALASPAQSVTLAAEIALARHYLAIEEIRFGARLQISWQLDPEAEQAKVPPLLLQPLVENAIRHGVEPSAEGAQLSICSRRHGNRVSLEVSNTTPAGASQPGNGLALANVRERLALLHDVQASFQTIHQDGVFHVLLELPACS